jgi:hypothetical protein
MTRKRRGRILLRVKRVEVVIGDGEKKVALTGRRATTGSIWGEAGH